MHKNSIDGGSALRVAYVSLLYCVLLLYTGFWFSVLSTMQPLLPLCSSLVLLFSLSLSLVMAANTVPAEFKAEPWEKGVFAVIVIGFIGVAGINTYFKMKNEVRYV